MSALRGTRHGNVFGKRGKLYKSSPLPMLRRWCMGYGYPCMKAKYLDGIPKLQELIRLMGISALRAKMKPSMTATINLFCRTTARGAARGWAVAKMDEYIKREAALALVRPDAPEDEKAAVTIATAKKLVRSIVRRAPAADVAPVVRCKDCEYSYDEISYLCCSHGVCVDCEVPPNFYCAEGKRKENDE